MELESITLSVWFLIGAVLVFFMQSGFAMVECGFTRAKNAGNILMKNLVDFCLGTVVFILLGYGLLVGPHVAGGFIGIPTLAMFGEGFASFDWSSFFFQLVFCAPCATIVSGAMAYTVKDGKKISNAIPAHNLPIGALGVFILWFGWYGFNGAAAGSVEELARILGTTTIAPAVATVVCMLVTWKKNGGPDVSMCLNGPWGLRHLGYPGRGPAGHRGWPVLRRRPAPAGYPGSGGCSGGRLDGGYHDSVF